MHALAQTVITIFVFSFLTQKFNKRKTHLNQQCISLNPHCSNMSPAHSTQQAFIAHLNDRGKEFQGHTLKLHSDVPSYTQLHSSYTQTCRVVRVKSSLQQQGCTIPEDVYWPASQTHTSRQEELLHYAYR